MTSLQNLSAMRLDYGQVTELMKIRPNVNRALLSSTCLPMLRVHIVPVPTNLRIHNGLDDILSMNFKSNWKSTGSIHRQVCFQE